MPWDYVIDTKQKMVYTRAWGDVTDADLIDHQRKLAADPEFHNDLFQLLDFLGATSLTGVTSEGIRTVAQRNLYGPHSRRAIVVSDLSGFGLARMFQSFRDIAGGEDQIRVFMSLEEARAWLGISSTEDTSKP